MATIAENLQTIKDCTDAIKQAIIDKGGSIEGDITTWASAISNIEGGGSSSIPNDIVLSDTPNEDNRKIFQYLASLIVDGVPITDGTSSPEALVCLQNNRDLDGNFYCREIQFQLGQLALGLWEDGMSYKIY